MLDRLTTNVSYHGTALALRAERQKVLASNIANADTPHYKARDFDFAQALANATGVDPKASGTGGAPRASAVLATHRMHFGAPGAAGGASSPPELLYRTTTKPSLDSNTVDMDRERASFVNNAVQYEATLRFINGASRSILSAIRGE